VPTLTIPDAAYRELADLARSQDTTIDALAVRLLGADSVAIDSDYHAECEADATPVPTLAEARAVAAKVPGSFAADLIAEREER